MSDRGRTLYLSIVAAAITSALTTYGLHALEGPSEPAPVEESESEEVVEVPSVEGLAQATAQELVQSRGLRVVVAGEEPSAEHAAGHVAGQEPLSGSQVPSGSAVRITLSTGAPQTTVPNLLGQPLELARATLTAAGLSVGEVSHTGEGDPGTVTGVSPAAGSEVEAGAAVDLIAAPAGVTIPELVGENYRTAQEQLQELGLEVQLRRRFNPDRRDFTVLALDPEAGTLVEPGSSVRMTINE